MKRYIFFLTLSVLSFLAIAQEKNRNHFGISADITTNIGYSGEYSTTCKKHLGIGATLSGNYKHHFNQEKGWFIKPELSVFYSVSEFCWEGWIGFTSPQKDSYSEFGMGIATTIGYEFPINKKISWEIFTGPDFRYSFTKGFVSYEYEYDNGLYYPAQLRWRLGAGVNVTSWNFHFHISPDLTVHQKDGRKKFCEFGLGVGYNF